MQLTRALTRFAQHGVPVATQRRAVGDLAAGWRALLTGDGPSAWTHLEAAHEATRNAGFLHAAAHASRGAAMLRAGRPGAAVGEARLAAMATPIAWTRRAAGIENEFPGGNGVRTSWRMRNGERILNAPPRPPVYPSRGGGIPPLEPLPPVSISVVVVTHRADHLLDACLASIAAQSRPPDDVLVVVSNTPRPVGGPALQLGENLGFARAANAGAAAVRGDILLLNDDTVLDPGCLAALERAWRGRGIYQPRIALADGSGRLDNLGHGFFPDGFVWARGRMGAPDATLPTPGGFSGAAVLIARSTWDELGGFDERFDSYGEDVDLSLRFSRRGGSIIAVSDALVHHHLGASYGRGGADKVRRIERNRMRAAVRSLPLSALATMPLWTGARLATFGALAAVGRGPGQGVDPGATRAVLAGLADGMRDAPEWWTARAADRPNWRRGELGMWVALWRGRALWKDVSRGPGEAPA